ncbi:MAG: GNAT family N-acetyltransferase [Fuerstiella sp.]|nr:GNAT family N-acetyltransferase [Fuerstiella sp.]
MVDFRTFHNTDPPRLLQLWDSSNLGPGAAEGFPCDVLELTVFSRPYFDRNGLILATDDGTVVGMVHAGFSATKDESRLDFSRGVISSLIVHPDYRRRKIGRQLIEEAERYLKSHGAREITAGAGPNGNGFYHSVYGGVEPSGFSSENAPWDEFFESCGYRAGEVTTVFHRDLGSGRDPIDTRLIRNRRRLNMLITDRITNHSWWWSARHSYQDTLQIELVDRSSGQTVATGRVVCLDIYVSKWGVRAVGIRDVVVTENQRRQGYAFSLVVETCRQLRKQSIGLVEVHVAAGNLAAQALAAAAQFVPVSELKTYHRQLFEADKI